MKSYGAKPSYGYPYPKKKVGPIKRTYQVMRRPAGGTSFQAFTPDVVARDNADALAKFAVLVDECDSPPLRHGELLIVHWVGSVHSWLVRVQAPTVTFENVGQDAA